MEFIEVGYGTSRDADALAAGISAAKQALGNIRHHAISVVLVFASVHYDLDRLLEGITTVTRDAPLVGITTAGEICNGVHRQSVVVTLLASPHLRVSVGLGHGVSADWLQAVDEAAAAQGVRDLFSIPDVGVWPELTRNGESVFAMLFSPGHTSFSDSFAFEITEELKRRSAGLFPIVGACAGDDRHGDANHVLHGRRSYPDSMLVMVIRTNLSFGTAMAHGFEPSSQRATVTRCKGYKALELDGRVAADVYAELMQIDRLGLAGKHLTLATGKPFGAAGSFGQYTINVASYLTDEGGVRLSQPVVEGTTLAVMESHPDRMIEAGPSALRKAIWRGQIKSPALVIAFPCALRSSFLGDRAPEEITAIKSFLPHTPVVGGYSFGEQGLADDGVNRHNNEVITLLVLGNELSAAALTANENKRLLAENTRMADALRLRNEELHLLLDTIDTQVWYLTDADTYGTLNRAHAEFLNIDPAHATGRKLDEFLPPDVAKICREGNAEVFRTRQPIRTEEWIPNGRGEPRLVDITKTPKLDASGNVAYVVCAGNDITNQRRDEEQLRIQAQILSNIQDNVILLSPEMKALYANRAAEEMFGSSPEMFTEPCHRYFKKRGEVCEGCPVAMVLEDRKPHQAIMKSFNRHGEETWRFNRAFPHYDRQGDLAGVIEIISDYTALKKAQDAVAEREERLELAMEGGGLGMWDWNLRTGAIVYNEQWARMLDHEPGKIEPHADSWQSLVHPDDLGAMLAALNAHWEGKTSLVETEHRMRCGSGEWKWILSKGKVTRRDEDGRPLRMVGTSLDVSERRQMLDLFAAQRDLALGLSSSTNVVEALERVMETVLMLGAADCGGVYLVDAQTGALDLVAHKGLSPEFVTSGRHFEADSPQARLILAGKPMHTLYSELLPNAIAGGRQEEGLRAICVIPILHDGRAIAALNMASHVHDELPAPFLSVLETIAAQIGGAIARLQAGERLRMTRENLQVLFDSIQDFLFVLDDGGGILHLNPAAEQRLGYSTGELLGKPVTEVHPPEQREEAIRIIGDMLADQRDFCPIPLLSRGGDCIPVETKVVRAKWNGEEALLGISRDITERLQGEEERLRLERQLAQIQKSESLGRMAGAIAHHFNNLLLAIMGNIELAQSDLDDRPHALELLNNAMTAVLRAAEVSRLMLTYTGTQAVERKPLDVTVAWSRSLSMLYASKPPNVRLLTDSFSSGSLVQAETQQMTQLLMNLVTNGWEAIGDDDGDVIISTSVVHGRDIEVGHVSTADWKPSESTYLCLEVSDTGCGIEEDVLSKIFEPFYSTKFLGRGMGLAVSAAIAKAHGGAITVDSKPGKGSVFRVFLPTLPPPSTGAVRKTDSAPSRNLGTILVADDDVAIRNTIQAILSHMGFDVIPVADGMEAVDAVGRLGTRIDLVLLDLSMPRMNGWQALEALRALSPDIPVILMSGYDETRVMDGHHSELPQAFLQKPFIRQDLKSAIEDALKARAGRD